MTEDLAAEAWRLWREEGRSAREIRQRLGVGRIGCTDARWEPHHRERDRRREGVHEVAYAQVGDLSARDLLLVGAATYWSEGRKSKSWRRDYSVVIVLGVPLDRFQRTTIKRHVAHPAAQHR